MRGVIWAALGMGVSLRLPEIRAPLRQPRRRDQAVRTDTYLMSRFVPSVACGEPDGPRPCLQNQNSLRRGLVLCLPDVLGVPVPSPFLKGPPPGCPMQRQARFSGHTQPHWVPRAGMGVIGQFLGDKGLVSPLD